MRPSDARRWMSTIAGNIFGEPRGYSQARIDSITPYEDDDALDALGKIERGKTITVGEMYEGPEASWEEARGSLAAIAATPSLEGFLVVVLIRETDRTLAAYADEKEGTKAKGNLESMLRMAVEERNDAHEEDRREHDEKIAWIEGLLASSDEKRRENVETYEAWRRVAGGRLEMTTICGCWEDCFGPTGG